MILEFDMFFFCFNLLVMFVNFLLGIFKDIKYNNVKVLLEGIEGVVVVYSLYIWFLIVNKVVLVVYLVIGVCMNKIWLWDFCCWFLIICYEFSCGELMVILGGGDM